MFLSIITLALCAVFAQVRSLGLNLLTEQLHICYGTVIKTHPYGILLKYRRVCTLILIELQRFSTQNDIQVLG